MAAWLMQPLAVGVPANGNGLSLWNYNNKTQKEIEGKELFSLDLEKIYNWVTSKKVGDIPSDKPASKTSAALTLECASCYMALGSGELYTRVLYALTSSLYHPLNHAGVCRV